MESKFSDQTFSFKVQARTQDSTSNQTQNSHSKVKEAQTGTDEIYFRDAQMGTLIQ